MSQSPPNPYPSAGLILVSLACIALYIVVMSHHQAELEEQVHSERERRRDAEQQARKTRDQLDGALATIHRLNPESDDGDTEQPAG